MRRVTVSLPATVTNLGPGLNSLGLALGLRLRVEFSDRSDEKLVVETSGEGAGRYAIGLRHPVLLGMIRVFQAHERAPLGLTIHIDNQIPLASGLGSEAAFLLAGVIGANNLLGSPLKREALLRFAVGVSRRPDHSVTAFFGGLTASQYVDEALSYAQLPIQAMQTVVVLPEIADFAVTARAAIPERVPLGDALSNLAALPLLIDGLRREDHALLRAGLLDALIAPHRSSHIPGFEEVRQAALDLGASGITLCGAGPALIAFAPRDHSSIADAMVHAFSGHGVSARSWVIPIDTQGIVLSAARSA
ncbi:MAG: homoserine kinase [Chloroflexi bacterium]|nr:homoserine kinase [Chloroflexota bacterium]